MRRLAFCALVPAIAVTAAPVSSGARLLRVAYVVPVVASPDPHDLYGAALLGFERAVKHFRIHARVVEFPPRAGAAPTLRALGAQRYDLVMIGEVRLGGDVTAVLHVARQFPGTKFVLTDPPVYTRWPSNVEGSIWRVEEPAYLAGYLAGLMERRQAGPDVAGSVGGFSIVPVNTFIKGFEAGARAADPHIRLLRGYTQDFLDPSRCRSFALAQIARGARVVFNVAGLCGLGTIDAAKRRGVWAVGVDVDQSFLGRQMLTSVLKRFDVEVYDTVQALVQGKLRTGGNMVWNLHNKAVGLGKISPEVPAAVLRRIAAVRAGIAAGRIHVPRAER